MGTLSLVLLGCVGLVMLVAIVEIARTLIKDYLAKDYEQHYESDWRVK